MIDDMETTKNTDMAQATNSANSINSINSTKGCTGGQIVAWLKSTCEDEDGHTCEDCFQGRPSCEFKYLAELIEKKWNLTS